MADDEDMKLRLSALLLAVTLAAGACSSATASPATWGVDGAPEIIRNTFLVVSREAATLANYDITKDELLAFAREVCDADLGSPADREAFAAGWAGSNADRAELQMWSTAAGAAASSFCPTGRG